MLSRMHQIEKIPRHHLVEFLAAYPIHIGPYLPDLLFLHEQGLELFLIELSAMLHLMFGL
jgi:hypothetical protein